MTTSETRRAAQLNRRELVALGIGAFAVPGMALVGNRRRQVARRSVPVMGTIAEIALVHSNVRYAQAAIDAAVAELRYVDATMSRFDQTSDVGRANASAAQDAVTITPATAAVLAQGIEWAEATDGQFDPSYGRAVELWDVKQRHAPPPPERVGRLAGRHLYRAVDLDEGRQPPCLRFTDPDVAIDLGGIAKGYAVDLAVNALRDAGIVDAVVNVGGDLYAMGRSATRDPWRIGVRSADNLAEVDEVLDLTDVAVATSGDYLQFFTHHGTRYHHLLDPATGAPRRSVGHSITVTAADCMTADAAATAAFGMFRPKADQLLENRGARIANTA